MSEHPVAPVRSYVYVFLALIVLTFTTVAVSFLELGEWNVVAAITIAVIKATLVVLFFMHVKEGTSLTKLTAVAGFFWLLILLAITLSDYATRGWQPLSKPW